MRRIPGKGKTYIVYDVFDRPVFSQDSALRAGKKWMGIIYDGQGRPSISGMLSDSIGYVQLQTLVTSQTSTGTITTIATDSLSTSTLILNSNPTTGDWRATTSINLANGFGVPAGTSFSSTIAAGASGKASVQVVGSPLPAGAPFAILAVLYYDDYTWLNALNNTSLGATLKTDDINSTNFSLSYNSSPYYPQPIIASIRTRGRLTGIKKAIIGSNNYLYSVSIYDEYGRVIQSKETNYSGGTDVATVQYTWDGRILNSLLSHQKSGNNAQIHRLQTAYTYDQSGRALSVTKNLDGLLSRTVTSNTYNELGQLQQKVIGSGMETQTYAYNIRGWLLSINGGYVGTSGSTSNYFGEMLAYDYGFTSTQLNGNIAGAKWKAAGDGTARAYGFSYDIDNRLTVADFSQQNGSNWGKSQADFTVDGISYDAGGNIRTMRQRGLKVGVSATIDSLNYQYFANSNQLQNVSDGIADPSPLGDFKDTTVTAGDYAYDVNGNIITDFNRRMCSSGGGQGAVYNFLDKPDSIGINGKAGIHYYYDAGGNQLYKQVNDYTPGASPAVKNYFYSKGFVYLNDTLQYVLQEEGRIRYARKVNSSTGAIYYAYEYDYFLRDHLGNVRTVLTEGKDTSAYAATMESKDSAVVSALFSNVYTPVNTVYPKPSGFDTDTSNHYIARLNASSGVNIPTGPSIVLKVMAGDQVQMSTYAYYTSPVQAPPSGENLLNSILPLLAGGVIGNSQGHLLSGDMTSLSNTLNPNVVQFLNNRSYDSTRPKAYLNWILFDDQFNYVASNSGVQQVQPGSSKQVLSSPTQTMSKNGYLYVYVSNESAQDVYFDNLTVKDFTGPLAQEQSYYPFGLQMAGISDKKLLQATNPYKFNGGGEYEEDFGVNYYNTMLRKYDPQIGRFAGVDMLAEQSLGSSPYQYASNDPIFFNDQTGAFNIPPGLPGSAQKVLQQFDDFSNEGSSQNLYQYDSETGGIYIGDVGGAGGGGGLYKDYWNSILGMVSANGEDIRYDASWAGSPQRFYNYSSIDGQYAFETPNWDGSHTVQEDIGYDYQNTFWRSGLPEEKANVVEEYLDPFLKSTTFARNVGTIGVVPVLGANWVWEGAKEEGLMALRRGINPVAEIKSLRTIAKIGTVADLAGKALGVVAAVDHGANAIKAFRNGDIGYGILNTAKVGLDIFFMFAKANPLVLAGSLVYAAVDMYTTKDE
jgi:RHS repeat-associated protein